MVRALAITLVLTLGLASTPGCRPSPSSSPPSDPGAGGKPAKVGPYLERRAAHRTQLGVHGPIRDTWPTEDAPAGATRVEYESDGRTLWGWLLRPPGDGPVPALVYLHGDVALTRAKLEALRPFVDAGFAVLAPTLRGRNGNPGDHELLYGEVDDARAAVRWLAEQPGIDGARLYAFGHSMGGGTAAMLSLYPDAAVRITGSCGGIYSTKTFAGWAKQDGPSGLVRFDPTDGEEVELRILGPHVDQIVHPHVAYFGAEEPAFRRNIEAAVAAAASPEALRMVEVPGDHMSALPAALAQFLEVIAADAGLR
jgi:dienelactone hydrolase